MKKRRMGFGRWVLKLAIRLVIAVMLLVAALYGGCYYYFVHLHPLGPQLKQAISERTKAYHIHPLKYQQIPQFYRDAIISTEDRRFWSDPGIDPVGIARSLFVDIQKDGYVEGGSTITQQLVDNTLLNHNKTLHRKLLQVVYAIGLYDTMSKEQTLTDYANMIYFGHQAYGLENASQAYFGKSVNKLNRGELAMLAGLPNAPTAYDPLHHMNLARAREKIVLENMEDAGRLTSQQAQEIYKEPIRLKKS